MSEVDGKSDPVFGDIYPTCYEAFCAGRAAGQHERGELFRLVAAGVACKYEREGNDAMAIAANEVCRLIFGLDNTLWPSAPVLRDKSGGK